MDKPVSDSVRVVICADDYGLSPGIGQATRELIEGGRLTATGCMTTSASWPAEARHLRALSGRCDVGLHLTLTDQRAAAPMARLAPAGRLPSLGTLMTAAAMRRLDRAEIEAEIERQIDRFEDAMGMAPHFVDGHQHVHQLPVVRDALLAVYERRLRQHNVWLRYCVESPGNILAMQVAAFRAAIIAMLGRTLARRGRRAGIPGNRGFRGVRSFTPSENFPFMMERFLAAPVDGMLIMCHPGLPDDSLAALDRVVDTRPEEYAYLRGSAFEALLRQRRVRLARLSEIASAEQKVRPSGAA